MQTVFSRRSGYKKKALGWGLVAASCLIVLSAPAQTEPAARGPVLQMETQQVDVGLVPYLCAIEHTFALSNAGDAPLELAVSKKDCKCSLAELSHRVLAPGQQGTLRIGYAPGERIQHGAVEYIIRLNTNDPAQANPIVSLKAQIVKPLEVSPQKVELQIKDNGNLTGSFAVDCYSFERLATITAINLSSPLLRVEKLADREIPHGVRHEYAISVAAEAPVRQVHESLTILADSEVVPQVEVPVVYVAPVTSLKARPSVLTLGVLPGNADTVKEIALVLENAPDAVITTATCADRRVQVELLPVDTPSTVAIRLTIAPAGTSGTLRAVLLLSTAGGETVRLPLLAVLASS